MGHLTCKKYQQLVSLELSLAIASGAAYEFHPVKHGDFDIYKEPRFTDDTHCSNY